MALKSSQPRRNASPRSDISILRTGYVAASPKTCRPNFAMLSEYVVAIDATSRAHGSGDQMTRRKPRVAALMCESRGRAEYGKPRFIERSLAGRNLSRPA